MAIAYLFTRSRPFKLFLMLIFEEQSGEKEFIDPIIGYFVLSLMLSPEL
jgi:hypothetical protein